MLPEIGCRAAPPARRRPLLLLVGLVLGLGLAGCSSGVTARRPFVAPHGVVSHPVRKLLVVVMENHSLSQMRRAMPYTWWLARRFGYATDYRAVSHPSLPNYLALVAGRTYGLTRDVQPSSTPLTGPTVFARALAADRTADVYLGAMPTPCSPHRTPSYGVAANPWTYFPGERRQCLAHDLPVASLWPAVRRGRLPEAGMVVPDRCDSGHDCPLGVADAWFQTLMTRIFAGPDWRAGDLAVLLTADEDDRHHVNKVLTVLIHPSQHHHVVAAPLDHYSVTRLYAQVTGTPELQHARTASSLAGAFGLPVAG